MVPYISDAVCPKGSREAREKMTGEIIMAPRARTPEKAAAGKTGLHRTTIAWTNDVYMAIPRFMTENGIKSFSEAVVRLVSLGLYLDKREPRKWDEATLAALERGPRSVVNFPPAVFAEARDWRHKRRFDQMQDAILALTMRALEEMGKMGKE
jgi:hypothetical protein